VVVPVGGLALLAVSMASQARAVDMGWKPLMRMRRRTAVLERRPDGVAADCAGANVRAETVAASIWDRCCRRRDAEYVKGGVACRRRSALKCQEPRGDAVLCAACNAHLQAMLLLL
jgi:hypothetical protein